MSREMLVNVAESEECRVAVIENGILEELYIERASLGSIVGNVYKGRVVNIEAGIQAAFVDLGTGRNGFLHISDLHPRYYSSQKTETVESVGRRQSLKDRPPIQDCLRKGNEIVVQVTKEGLKTKGPTLSTYLALPGKYIVMMPWMKKHGISHKIDDEDERKRLRTALEESNPPKNVGCIIRTAGDGCTKRDLQSDLRYLTRMWNAIQKNMDSSKAPVALFQESDLVIRALRDVFNSTIDNVICDSEPMVRKIKEFLSHAYPRLRRRVSLYENGIPLFHKYHIEKEIDKIQSRTVALRSGGSIVIEQTEALVAIDVNSGRHHGTANAEATALATNLEAATEIARQLRLRDLGGLIICDFIDMRQQKSRKEVERVFRQAMKDDRARSKTLAISRFGVVEMTRQRMRPSLQSSIYLACPHCAGVGFVKSHESIAIEVIRLINLAASCQQIVRIDLSVSPEVAEYLQNEKRAALTQIEQDSEKRILIHAMPNYGGGKHELVCYNNRGSVVRVEDMLAESACEQKKHCSEKQSRPSKKSSDHSRTKSNHKKPSDDKKAPPKEDNAEKEGTTVKADVVKDEQSTDEKKNSHSKRRSRGGRRRRGHGDRKDEKDQTTETKEVKTSDSPAVTESDRKPEKTMASDESVKETSPESPTETKELPSAEVSSEEKTQTSEKTAEKVTKKTSRKGRSAKASSRRSRGQKQPSQTEKEKTKSEASTEVVEAQASSETSDAQAPAKEVKKDEIPLQKDTSETKEPSPDKATKPKRLSRPRRRKVSTTKKKTTKVEASVEVADKPTVSDSPSVEAEVANG